MQPIDHECTYQAYLLRLWRDDGHAPWRASLQSPRTHEVRSFANVERLVAFLASEMAAPRATVSGAVPDDGPLIISPAEEIEP